jgi:RNA polymerase sigma-70 factor (ECF subfamily)
MVHLDEQGKNGNLIDDTEIVRRILEGEKDLYALIIRKYNLRLFRIGLSIVNNDAVVEEVMQIAYIKAYENLEKFRFESNFSTWLTKILINESLMYLKRRKQTTRREQTQFSIDFVQAIEGNTPLKETLNSELKTILENSIKKLPEKYRTVFVVRLIENMSVAETMECLELSETSVKVRLNRAKSMLRNKLSGYVKIDEIMKFYKPRCDRVVDAVIKRIMMTSIEQ